MQCVIHTVFLLFHLNLRRSTYVKNSYTAGHLSQTLLQFLFIVIRCRVLHLDLDLADTSLDSLLVTSTIYNGSGIFVYRDLLSGT